MTEKQKFIPYMLKRMFSGFIALLLIIALVVALRVHKENNTCIDTIFYHGCYTPGGCYKHGFD